MARNGSNPSERRTPSRVTKAPVERAPTLSRYEQQKIRKRFWLRIMVAFLVLAMLLPVVAAFL